MEHEGTAAQPVDDPGVADAREGGADPDTTTPVDRAPDLQRPAEPVRDDVEGHVDGLLADVTALPLREQVGVFESVHAVLTDRLSEKDA